ncbi:hypothetical protein MLP_27880 [Microlunatus phosphovorus NM-1]|uniref:Aminoglycoside phosphotransferase domain-containing protein n=1 Tax=Microlunatus phosphovorus (strain ATCC 700054 / DSM 10555 / JCM 9379 / NBRC 101784 / NCIMB 13414 / VKM Ac-1990 / NM-1) TaxID=1032480 RepID=F5XID3_MICPN|nr:aminoglycoside phosphotransferase family protein [Microlunatus phosphovorus]BAK35802.1 hypothetical protein MLP_27880 [Microlunatus phosphovorus NM-1]
MSGTGGRRREVVTSDRVRIDGGLVRRPAYPWTATVHDLLRHLHAAGFVVPEPVALDTTAPASDGAAIGVETVRFVPGVSGADAWRLQATDEGLRSAARLLRQVHEATWSWTPPADAVWAFPPAADPSGTVCHGDPGPWNMVWRDGQAVGLIDWDLARPAPALDDIAYALDYLAPFRGDEDSVRWHGFDTPPDRRMRIRVFLDAYGIDPPAIVDTILARRRATADELRSLAARGVEPQRTWVAEGFLETSERHLAWSVEHRALMEPVPDKSPNGC